MSVRIKECETCSAPFVPRHDTRAGYSALRFCSPRCHLDFEDPLRPGTVIRGMKIIERLDDGTYRCRCACGVRCRKSQEALADARLAALQLLCSEYCRIRLESKRGAA